MTNAKKPERVGTMKRYNHMYDITFTVETETEDSFEVSAEEIISGLEKRINYLRENPFEIADAIGHYDSYEIER